jgi:hypothetical protein
MPSAFVSYSIYRLIVEKGRALTKWTVHCGGKAGTANSHPMRILFFSTNCYLPACKCKRPGYTGISDVFQPFLYWDYIDFGVFSRKVAKVLHLQARR